MFSSFSIHLNKNVSLGDVDKSISLNNDAYQAFERGDYKTSLTKYQQAIAKEILVDCEKASKK